LGITILLSMVQRIYQSAVGLVFMIILLLHKNCTGYVFS